MPHDIGRRASCAIAGLIALILLTPAAAWAQLRAGTIFNGVFNVGGIGTRVVGSQPGDDDGAGSAGCGGSTGTALSQDLNSALGESGLDAQAPEGINGRRELWRFCDAMTVNNMMGGAGAWTTTSIISPDQERLQNTGLAPAGLFSQTDIARDLGRWQMQGITSRIQMLRTAMRDERREEDGELAPILAIRPALRPAVVERSPAQEQLTWSFADQEKQRLRATDDLLLGLMGSGLSAGENTFGISGLGVFLNGRYNRVNADTSLDQLGGKTNGGGFTLGADYSFEAPVVLGGAFSYSHFKSEFDNNLGEAKIDDYAFLGLGSWFITDALYTDFMLRGSIMRFQQQKIVPTFDAGQQFSERLSDPGGWTLSADMGLGYDYARDQWVINPYVRLRVYHTRIDAFTESGGDGTLNLRVNEQRVTSVPLVLGASVGRNISTRAGVIAPYIRGQYLHEFKDQAAAVSGFLAVLPSAGFKLDPNSPDRNYGTIGAGSTLTLAGGWAGFIDYDALVGFTDLVTHTLTLGVRRGF